MMINCDVVRAELQDYFDKELDKNEESAIRIHLDSCRTCQRDAFLLYSTFVLLRHLPDKEPDKEYLDFATKSVLTKIPLRKANA